MLDEREFAEVTILYAEAMNGTKHFRSKSGASLKHPHIDELFKPVRDRMSS